MICVWPLRFCVSSISSSYTVHQNVSPKQYPTSIIFSIQYISFYYSTDFNFTMDIWSWNMSLFDQEKDDRTQYFNQIHFIHNDRPVLCYEYHWICLHTPLNSLAHKKLHYLHGLWNDTIDQSLWKPYIIGFDLTSQILYCFESFTIKSIQVIIIKITEFGMVINCL